MTIIYFKQNGRIKNIFSGNLQTMETVYGDLAVIYKQICDEVTLDDDDYVLLHSEQFIINTASKQLEILPAPEKYQLAVK